MSNRYQVSGPEGEFQTGSDGAVLANKLGIQTVNEINAAELLLLEQLYVDVLIDQLPDRTLTVNDLRAWHRRWLGNVYAWAGQERSVNMSKGGFAFAVAAQIPRLLGEWEQNYLQRWTPCHDLDDTALVEAIAVTHVELILIHPFREGNGRLARLLADVMAVQSGRDSLDYSSWETHKADYVGAIHQGMAMNYEPMKYWVARAMEAADGPIAPA